MSDLPEAADGHQVGIPAHLPDSCRKVSGMFPCPAHLGSRPWRLLSHETRRTEGRKSDLNGRTQDTGQVKRNALTELDRGR